MEIQGKITLFVAKREIEKDGSKKQIVDLTTTLSSKVEEGKYLNKKVVVRLVGKKFPEESLAKLDENKCYQFDIYTGFLAVRSWKDRHGEERRDIEIVVSDGKLLSAKEVVRKEVVIDNDLPF